MTERTSRRSKQSAEPSRNLLVYSWRFFAGMVITVGVLFAAYQTERFLIRDTRFYLNGPAEHGYEHPNLTLTGVRHASRSQILKVFAIDYSRSVYRIPLEERRRELLQVSWVKDATIMRIWPDQLKVHIVERKPVAFLPAGDSRVLLIDADGEVMEPPRGERFRLPVLEGVQPDDALAVREDRVRRMLHVLREAGSRAGEISEIDMGEPDNVKATLETGGRAITLLLGDHSFGPRFTRFFNHYPDIRKYKPEARIMDLRLDDRIITVR
jgi:cell division protein FtsQ